MAFLRVAASSNNSAVDIWENAIEPHHGSRAKFSEPVRSAGYAVNIPPNKKIACIAGTVWTGKRSAPRRMLVRDGFVRPIWFTTGRRISDAQYEPISKGEYHSACAKGKVLAHMKHGSDFVGVLEQDFEDAVIGAQAGVLVVGFPEIVSQIAKAFPQTIVFALKDRSMELSDHLAEAKRSGQLRRINVDVFEPGVWGNVYQNMLHALGLPSRQTY